MCAYIFCVYKNRFVTVCVTDPQKPATTRFAAFKTCYTACVTAKYSRPRILPNRQAGHLAAASLHILKSY